MYLIKLACLRNFAVDKSGAISVIFALTAMPIFGIVGIALQHGQQSTDTANIGAWIGEACQRSNSDFFSTRTADDRRSAAQQVMDRRASSPDVSLPADYVYSVTESADVVTVNASGSSTSALSGLIGSGDTAFSISRACSDAANASNPRPPSGTIIFAGSFEQPQVAMSGYSGWYVEPYLPDWERLSGVGVQLNDDNHSGSISAVDGQQYAELDADTARGALGGESTNTQIAADLNLWPGNYEFGIFVHGNPAVGGNTAQENKKTTIDVLDAVGLVIASQTINTPNANAGWHERTFSFSVPAQDVYRLVLTPLGVEDNASSYIDMVTVTVR